MITKKIVPIIIGLLCVTTLQAQNSDSFNKVVFQTNGTCASCKNKIEKALAYEKGVKDVNYDLATSKVSVLYNKKKTNPQKLQKAIFDVGYQAEIVTEGKEGCEHNCGHSCSGRKTENCSGHSNGSTQEKPCCQKKQ